MSHALITIGLVLLTCPFWISAFLKTSDFQGACAEVESLGMPFPILTALATILVQAGGSVMIIVGFFPVIGAAVLGGFTILATLLGHAFWRFSGAEREKKLNGFLANSGLLGGLILAAALQIGT